MLVFLASKEHAKLNFFAECWVTFLTVCVQMTHLFSFASQLELFYVI